MIRFSYFVLLILLPLTSDGATWYVSTSGLGDGTAGNPWSLKSALTNVAIAAGDTVYLRGGIYTGLGYVSTLSGAAGNQITVRSAPSEWARITDGVIGYLGTTMDGSTSSGIVITNSEDAAVGQIVMIDTEQMRLNIPHTSNAWKLDRGVNSTVATNHAAGSPVVFCNAIISHSGSYATFRDFEITSVMSTNRNVGTNWWLGSGLDLSSLGVGNRAVGLIVHNVGHPGIGFWSQGAGAEINGCLIWGVGMYDYSPDYNGGIGTARGSGIYAQNSAGLARVVNNISFRNFTSGGKVYGEAGPVFNFQFSSNIVFQCNPSLEGSSGSTSTSNLWFNANALMGSPSLAYVSVSNRAEYVVNNIMVNAEMYSKEHLDSVYTNNIIFAPQNKANGTLLYGYQTTQISSNNLNVTWDFNTYYWPTNTTPWQWAWASLEGAGVNSAAGGLLRWDNDSGKAFVDWSGWDSHSSYFASWPSAYLAVRVQPLDYDANRWHIAVVNTDTNLTGTTVNLASSCGFSAGQYYRLRDAQNYFVPIAQGFYGGGTINLPLNLTNVSTINGALTHMTNEHTNVKNPGLFNAFVLERIAGMNRVAAVRAGQIRGK